MSRVYCAFLIFFSFVRLSFGQCPISSFTIPSTICKSENISLTNGSVNASSYNWDFCGGDLVATPIINSKGTISAAASPLEIKIIEDGGNYYGFVTSRTNGKLFRLDFGTNPIGTPTIVDVGNVTTLSVGWEQIDFIKDNGNWYGLIADFSDAKVLLADFGTSLKNVPTITEVVTGISLTLPRSVRIVKEGANIIGFVSNGQTIITRINFGSSFSGTPTSTNITVTGAAGLYGMSLVNECGNKYIIASSYGNGRIYKLSFGTSLLSAPTTTFFTLSGATLTNPTRLEVVEEGGKYYGICVTLAGKVNRVEFGNSLSSTSATVADLGNFTVLKDIFGFSLVRYQSSYLGLAIDYNSKIVRSLEFAAPCNSNIASSTNAIPMNVHYSQAGTYTINLKSANVNGVTNSISKQIVVTDNEAPQIEFTSLKECISAPVDFSGSITNGQTISSWNWDFGDPGSGTNNTSSLQNPSHQFAAPGLYSVKLSVVNAAGCTNSLAKEITIYSPTTANFSLPPSPTCSNQEFTFLNQSTGETGGKVIWQWEISKLISGEVIGNSVLKDAKFIFPVGGEYKIKLTAGVNGCTSVIEKNITIKDGPSVDFSYTNNCLPGSAVSFVNKSSGDDILSNSWEIRKADNTVLTTSSSVNLSYSFPLPGSYNVKLIVQNQEGCTSSTSKIIVVSNANKAEINAGVLIENIKGSFEGVDLTGADDDIVEWEWDFASLGSLSTKNAEFAFPAPGNYSVELKVTTAQGCIQTIEKDVLVAEAFCPSTSFTIPSTACKGENISFTNGSVNANSYNWDFCGGDLVATPVINSKGTISAAASPLEIKIIEDGGKYYGFVTSRSDGKLFRLDFGINLVGTPAIVDVGNVTTLSVGWEQIDFIKDNGNWYGLIADFSDAKVLLADFGTSLENVPTITEVVTGVSLTLPRSVRIVKEGANIIGFVSNGQTIITRINFGSSFSGTPTSTNITVTGAAGLYGMSLVNECGNKYIIASSYGNGRIYKLSFGTSLLSAPTDTFFTLSGATLSNPTRLEVVEEGGKYYGICVTLAGKVNRVEFGNSLSSTSATVVDLGNFTVLKDIFGFSLVRYQSSYLGLAIDYNTKIVRSLEFAAPCNSNIASSTNAIPLNVHYPQAGTYTINLTSSNASGITNSISKQIIVTDNEAPQGDFSTLKECISAPVDFTGTITNGQTISTWNWDFGDPGSGTNNTSNLQNPSHQFSAPGIYKVKLVVTSENGCTNTYIRNDTIYDETQPNLVEQSGLLCSSGPILFTNTSTKEIGPKVKWLWDFGDGQTSTEKEPTHTYQNGGTYTVTLTAGVEGCSNTFSKDIEVIQGPNTNFSFQNHCLGETTSFTNETIGDNITGYEWDFGDGNTSTVASPQHTYTAIGKYNVELKVTNINGCEVTKTIEVQIHDLPVVDFTPSAILCNADSLQFIDNSTLSDGNITGWIWTINNEQLSINNQFTGKDAKLYFPEPGDYKVTLTATSEAGCSTSATKDLTILKSPEISIDATNLCAGDSAVLEGVSELENQNIVAWTWQMSDGGMNEGQNIRHKFASPGTYIIYFTAISENSCPKTIVKEVTVYSKPVAKFGSVNNCLNAPVQFSDSSTVDGDVITSWNWKVFNEQLTMINEQSVQHPQFTFNAAGNYQVELTVATAHGCSSTIRKTVIIHPLPVASFTFEPEVGPPPFQVQFQNSSAGAVTYFWDFGNGDTSTEIAPQYTYNVLGTYDVRLISVNAFGCSDTIVKKLLVAPPVTSVAMERILVSTLTEELAFATELTNTGSKIVRSIEFIIDFGGNLSFKEMWTGVLNPEEKMTYSIKTQLLKEQLAKVKYICITAVELNNEAFDFETNNVCINLADQFFVFNPQPNPADDVVSFSYILPEDKPLEINFYTTNGQKITMNMPQYRQGYNQSSFSISSFAQGMYFVEFVYGGQRTKKKLVVY